MFRFFRDLCAKSDEERLKQAIEKSCLTFRRADGSSEFSSESNTFLWVGHFLLEHLDELMGDSLTTDVHNKIEQHDLIVAGTITIVLIMNYHKYSDPLVPFSLCDLENGLEIDLNSAWRMAHNAIDYEAQNALLKYISGIGKKILIDKKFPLLQFDSPSGGSHPFHCSVDSLLINPHQGVKRHSCLMLYDSPGQSLSDYWGGGMSRHECIEAREHKKLAMEQMEQASDNAGFRF